MYYVKAVPGKVKTETQDSGWYFMKRIGAQYRYDRRVAGGGGGGGGW